MVLHLVVLKAESWGFVSDALKADCLAVRMAVLLALHKGVLKVGHSVVVKAAASVLH